MTLAFLVTPHRICPKTYRLAGRSDFACVAWETMQ